MVKLTKIYTRGGDEGFTSLGSGDRVAKYSDRPAAYGAVDEANAAIGLARLEAPGTVDEALARIQNDLFDLVLFNGDEELGVDRNDVRPQSKQRGPDSGSADSMATMNKSIRRDTPYKASRTDEYEDGYNIADEYSSDAGYYGESSSGNNSSSTSNDSSAPATEKIAIGSMLAEV